MCLQLLAEDGSSDWRSTPITSGTLLSRTALGSRHLM
jgi:hypothetical protein